MGYKTTYIIPRAIEKYRSISGPGRAIKMTVEYMDTAKMIVNSTAKIAMATRPVTHPMMGQMQAYSPFNGKKYETLSYLPPLSDGQIKAQIDFMIKNRWTPCLEVAGDGDIYLNTAMGPGYYDNRYWSLYKLPMFGCTDSNEVINAIETCKREMPMAKIRVIGFDSSKQVQTAGFIVKK